MAFTREMLAEKGISEELIEQLIEEHAKTVQKSQAEADGLREKAKKADELEKQLKEREKQDMTELEQAQKEAEEAKQRVAELERQQVTSEVKSIFAEAGLKEDDYKDFLSGFSGSDIETAKSMASALVTTIENAKKDADKKAREELLDGTGGGDGGKGGNGNGGEGDDKSLNDAEKLAVELGKKSAKVGEAASKVLENYM